MHKRIKKITAVFFYMVLIYHLLPFSPIALYYTSHHSCISIKTQHPGEVSVKTASKSIVSPVVKEKSSFDIDYDLFLTPLAGKLTVSSRNISFPVFNAHYFNPLFSYRSGRDPPPSLS